jgi:fucose 4-O-acetylase-like acetyltransferase
MVAIDSTIESDKGSIQEIILLRGLTIMLVVLGHANIAKQITPQWFMFLKEVVYSFHMPVFLIISGFLFIYTSWDKRELKWQEFMIKKVKRLVLPAIVLLSFAFVLRCQLAYMKGADFQELYWLNYLKMFIYKEYLPIEFYWFTFCLIGIFVFGKGMWYVMKKQNLIMGVWITAIFLILNLFTINVQILYIAFIAKNLLYFWMGCIAYIAIEKCRIGFTCNRMKAGLFSCLLGGGLFAINRYAPFHNNSIGGLLSVLCGLGCCAFGIRFLRGYPTSLLYVLGNYSYQVYLMSWFFHRMVETICFQVLKLGFFITFPLSFCCALMGPVLLAKLVERKVPSMGRYIGL